MNYHKEKKANRRLIWVSFISSFFLLFFAIKISLSQLSDRKSIVEIKGNIESIKFKKGRKGSNTLVINLNVYPDIKFKISGVSLKVTSFHDLMYENKPGDSITLFIEKQEYNRKISKTEKMPFPQKYFYPNNISVVEIHNRNTEYLSLDSYNNEHRHNNYLAIAVLGFFGLLMLFLGFRGLKYYSKNFK